MRVTQLLWMVTATCLGNLRFEKPFPATKWTGLRDASRFGDECMQRVVPEFNFHVSDIPLNRSEDCLYLNVYKPVVSSDGGLLPVMVWIHGGGYYLGAGSQYEGSDLAANGVIVVTINYRLGLYGYMSNEDDVIPGNYGMLDQVLALKWVQESIRSFGGDPNKVTIFGESAGSSSCSLLILSPLTKGLFQRAIMESGTSICPWALQVPSERITQHQIVNLIGSGVGCNQMDAKEKLECFRNVDADTLFNASLSVGDTFGVGILTKPVVETTFGFLPDLPSVLWTQNKFKHIDTMRGFNRAEMGLSGLMLGNYSITKQNFTDGLRESLDTYVILGRDQLYQDIAKTYVGNEMDGHEILLSYIDAFSDIVMAGPILVEANMESQLSPEKNHYMYEFDHKPSLSKSPAWMPAVHADELQFVFGVHLKQFQVKDIPSPSDSDKAVSRQVQTLWTNFAKYGKPTTTIPSGAVEWGTYNSTTANVLKIDTQSQLLSYKKHKSLGTYRKFMPKIGLVIPDRFIVG